MSRTVANTNTQKKKKSKSSKARHATFKTTILRSHLQPDKNFRTKVIRLHITIKHEKIHRPVDLVYPTSVITNQSSYETTTTTLTGTTIGPKQSKKTSTSTDLDFSFKCNSKPVTTQKNHDNRSKNSPLIINNSQQTITTNQKTSPTNQNHSRPNPKQKMKSRIHTKYIKYTTKA